VEILYDAHALERMQERHVREEHIRYVLLSGHFVRKSHDGRREAWEARILTRRIRVVVEWLQGDMAYVHSVWV